MFTEDPILLIIAFSSLLLVSVLCSKAAARTGLPVLLVFLLIGMGVRILSGTDKVTHYYRFMQAFGGVTLALVLFSGGLNTQYDHVRPIIYEGLSLSTIGVLLTTTIVGAFMHYVFDFSWPIGLLLGAVVSSTDAAAVFSILRVNKIYLQHRLSPLLELESGSNDAMAYFLTATFTSFLLPGPKSWITLPLSFAKEMVLGGLFGVCMGWLMRKMVNRVKLNYDALYPALTLAMLLLTYALTHAVHGNSFLAVYVAGMVMGHKRFIHRKSLTSFYEGISWLAQIVLFVGLGLLVNPWIALQPILVVAIPLALWLIFVARPISVFSALYFSTQINHTQKKLISWVGLRGAVPLVLAMYPLLHTDNMLAVHAKDCEKVLHIVYIIVVASMLLQGTTLYRVAQTLGLVAQAPAPQQVAAITLSEKVKRQLIETRVTHTSQAVGKRLFELELPKTSLVVLIERDQQYIIPRGDTLIASGDRFLILVGEIKDASVLRACLV